MAGQSQALDLEQFHVKFSVKHRTTGTASTLEARIYNMSDATAKTIQNEFTAVQLQAGYQNSTGTIFGIIFTGSIVQIRRGRENPTDTYFDIYAAAGDIPRNWAVTRAVLAAGYSPNDELNVLVQSLSEYGVKIGYITPLPAIPKASRGRSFYASTRDALDDLGKTYGVSAYINGATGQLEIVSDTGYAPGDPVELTSHTGLIGLPQQTQGGITARCLLRPSIIHNRLIHINNASIQTGIIGTQIGPDEYTAWQNLPTVTADGYYRVLAVDHTGDTRGQPWYTDMWCVGLTGTYPKSGAVDLDKAAEWNDPAIGPPPPLLPVPAQTPDGQ